MQRRLLWYTVFFVLLVTAFWVFLYRDKDLSRSLLAIRIDSTGSFSFIDQDRRTITQNDVAGKVYVAEFFFTSCQGICPKMNANMRKIYDTYKNEPDFMILSHTCMPETDSVPLLKAYEDKMVNGQLTKAKDGGYKIVHDTLDTTRTINNNWKFLTGDKTQLYKMARTGYGIDRGKFDSTVAIKDQFIHTQFFALVDKFGRVRGMVYDGLKEDEVQQMIGDIKGLLKEKVTSKRFLGGFGNNPE